MTSSRIKHACANSGGLNIVRKDCGKQVLLFLWGRVRMRRHNYASAVVSERGRQGQSEVGDNNIHVSAYADLEIKTVQVRRGRGEALIALL